MDTTTSIIILIYGIISFGLGFYYRPRIDAFIDAIFGGLRRAFGPRVVRRGQPTKAKRPAATAEQLKIEKVGTYNIDDFDFDVIIKPPIDDYDRDLYDPPVNTRIGGNWSPREQVLMRDSLVQVTLDARGSKIIAGQWKCPYSGKVFLKPSDIEIDHIVPLAESWICGAKNWDKSKRTAICRDLENLRAVSAQANQQKGRKAPNEWMPVLAESHLWYIQSWIHVKRKYNLGMSREELLKIAEYAK